MARWGQRNMYSGLAVLADFPLVYLVPVDDYLGH